MSDKNADVHQNSVDILSGVIISLYWKKVPFPSLLSHGIASISRSTQPKKRVGNKQNHLSPTLLNMVPTLSMGTTARAYFISAACAAASLATGTLGAEQET